MPHLRTSTVLESCCVGKLMQYLFGSCIFGMYQGRVRGMSGACQGRVRGMSGACQGHVNIKLLCCTAEQSGLYCATWTGNTCLSIVCFLRICFNT